MVTKLVSTSMKRPLILIIYCLVLLQILQAQDISWIENTKTEVITAVSCPHNLYWKYIDSTDSAKGWITKDTLMNLVNSSKYEITKRRTTFGSTRVMLIIHDVQNEDSGIYTYNIGSQHKNITFNVRDFKWMNGIEIINVNMRKGAELNWTLSTTIQHKDITLYRTFSEQKEGLAHWSKGVLDNERFTDRMDYSRTQLDNDRERVTMVINNITTDDLKYIYKTKVQVSNWCSFYGATMTLKEDIKFEWINTTNPVRSTIGPQVELVWEYRSSHLARKIVFSRDNKGDHCTELGTWTLQNGFADCSYSLSKLEFDRPENISGGERISLKIIESKPLDFNQNYTCTVVCGQTDSSRKTRATKLLADRPEWMDPITYVDTNIGDNATFTWKYRYEYRANSIVFKRKNESNMVETLGFWYQTVFNPFERKIVFNKEEAVGYTGEVINMTLPDTTEDDFGLVYECLITLNDGQSIKHGIRLLKYNTIPPNLKTKSTTEIMDTILTNRTERITVAVVVVIAVEVVMIVVVVIVIMIVIVVVVILKRRKRRKRKKQPEEENQTPLKDKGNMETPSEETTTFM